MRKTIGLSSRAIIAFLSKVIQCHQIPEFFYKVIEEKTRVWKFQMLELSNPMVRIYSPELLHHPGRRL